MKIFLDVSLVFLGFLFVLFFVLFFFCLFFRSFFKFFFFFFFFAFVPRGKSSVSSLGCFCCFFFLLKFLVGMSLFRVFIHVFGVHQCGV